MHGAPPKKTRANADRRGGCSLPSRIGRSEFEATQRRGVAVARRITAPQNFSKRSRRARVRYATALTSPEAPLLPVHKEF